MNPLWGCWLPFPDTGCSQCPRVLQGSEASEWATLTNLRFHSLQAGRLYLTPLNRAVWRAGPPFEAAAQQGVRFFLFPVGFRWDYRGGILAFPSCLDISCSSALRKTMIRKPLWSLKACVDLRARPLCPRSASHLRFWARVFCPMTLEKTCTPSTMT